MMAKVGVNGTSATRCGTGSRAAPGVLGTRRVKWNFTKFLVGRDGKVIRRYAPNEEPDALQARHRSRAGQPLSAASPQCRRARTNRPLLSAAPRGPCPCSNTSSPTPATPSSASTKPFRRYPRVDKVNLSIGIYYDEAGRIPVLESVRQAEASPWWPRRRAARISRWRGAANYRQPPCNTCCLAPSTRPSKTAAWSPPRPSAAPARMKIGADFLKRLLPQASEVYISRPELGKPPLDVRSRWLRRCDDYPYFDARHPRRAL
jgi:hypothetical protein